MPPATCCVRHVAAACGSTAIPAWRRGRCRRRRPPTKGGRWACPDAVAASSAWHTCSQTRVALSAARRPRPLPAPGAYRMLDPPVLACRRPRGRRRHCTTQTRWLGRDGWEGARGASSSARADRTCFMHCSPGEDTRGHPFMPTVSAFQSRAEGPLQCFNDGADVPSLFMVRRRKPPGAGAPSRIRHRPRLSHRCHTHMATRYPASAQDLISRDMLLLT